MGVFEVAPPLRRKHTIIMYSRYFAIITVIVLFFGIVALFVYKPARGRSEESAYDVLSEVSSANSLSDARSIIASHRDLTFDELSVIASELTEKSPEQSCAGFLAYLRAKNINDGYDSTIIRLSRHDAVAVRWWSVLPLCVRRENIDVRRRLESMKSDQSAEVRYAISQALESARMADEMSK